jgi:hypothetical protein
VVENEAINCTRAVTVAFVDGFLFYTVIFLTMKLSHGAGGYYNPAISLSLSMTDIYLEPDGWRRHLIRFATFLVAQIAGAITGNGTAPPTQTAAHVLCCPVLSCAVLCCAAYLTVLLCACVCACARVQVLCCCWRQCRAC